MEFNLFDSLYTGNNSNSDDNFDVSFESALAETPFTEVPDDTYSTLSEISLEAATEMSRLAASVFVLENEALNKQLSGDTEASVAVLEAVSDKKGGHLQRVKTALLKALKAVQEWFKRMIDKVKSWFLQGEKFAKEFGPKLEGKSTAGFSYKGFNYTIDAGNDYVRKQHGRIQEFLKEQVDFELGDSQRHQFQGSAPADHDGMYGQRAHIAGKATGPSQQAKPALDSAKEALWTRLGVKDAGELSAKVAASFRDGAKEKSEQTNVSVPGLLKILKEVPKQVREFQEAAKQTEAAYKIVLQSVDRASKSFSKEAGKDKASAAAFNASFATHKYNLANYGLTQLNTINNAAVQSQRSAVSAIESILRSFMSYKGEKSSGSSTTPTGNTEEKATGESSNIIDTAMRYLV